MDALATFSGIRVVPVVALSDSALAVPLAQTLAEAGIRAVEITLRTPQALASIEAVAAAVPDMLVGAGSIRSAEQVAQCVQAGARFLVSPGSSPAVLAAVEAASIPFVPGTVSASEIMTMAEAGYQLVKFFPAEPSGGTAMLKALSAPLPEARFFPTGGISAELAREYLALPSVACVGGSWFVPDAALAAGDFETIGKLARAAAAFD